PENRPVFVGNVPADGGTVCLRTSAPASASTGTMSKKRPTSIEIAPVVLNQSVLPERPPNADPLLLPCDVNAYVISVSPCGPPLMSAWRVLSITSDAALNPRTTMGTNRM